MKKILFVISQLYKGGAELSLVNLLNHLDYKKYKVELLILNQSPVENAVSLVSRINKNVKVCDAYKEYQKITILDRIRAKLIYTEEQKGAYYLPALDFVKNKIYDWAFFIGEWYSPSFVAYEVQAKIKAAWIHNDLSEAEYFNAEHYFYFADRFDYFIFVSQNSLKWSIKKYPFLKEKSVCIYNINDVDYILKSAKARVKDWPKQEEKLPVLLTCANFRPQKNHLRQVKVMAELKHRGIDFIWINIGATTDKRIVNQVKRLCKKEGLEERFLILGPKENPYQYMKRVDAITVLSDYESWSMVITEAKIIGIPVISTKTSGAVEQIEDEKTGILTGFSVNEIADKIEKFIKDKQLQKYIKENIKNFDNTEQIVDSFSELIENGKSYAERKAEGNSILYIIDNINYIGGAHIATKLQIKEFIQEGRNITVFSGNVPELSIREEMEGVHFLSWKDFREDVLFNKKLMDCFTNKTVSWKERWEKLKQVKEIRILKNKNYYEKNILPKLEKVFSRYEIICVMSEGSSFRYAAAKATCKRKIQWIHIDYCDWKESSEWNKKITKNDGKLYKKFDRIVVLTEEIKESFSTLYPHLRKKVVVNRNLMPVEEIQIKAENLPMKNKRPIKFVTVSRIDYQKAYPRLIKILVKLKQKGYQFRWTIIGGGEDFEMINGLIKAKQLEKWVKMLGALENPFIEEKKADIFALLSDFEGIPNTIYEALILGIPVLATDVGGVSTQIEDGVNGWLVENREEYIFQKLEWLFTHEEEIEKVRENNRKYNYDNQKVREINKEIFTV